MDRAIISKKGIKRRHLPYLAAGACLLILVGWMLFGSHKAALHINKDDVTIASVTYGEFKDFVRINGTVIPIQVVQISPEEGGIVLEKVAEEGSMVKRGDVIVKLSNSSLDLQILNAEAELAEKQNLLRNTQLSMQQERLNNELESASLNVEITQKRRAFEQDELLYRKKLISRELYTQSKEAYELVAKKQALVTERLKQDDSYRRLQMEQMEENLQNMRKNVLLVRDRKEKLEVRSSIDGELGLLDVELGQSITAGQKIGQINDLDAFKIEAQIDEHYIDRVKAGLSADFEREGKTFKLRLRKVFPEVRNGRFKVEMLFEGMRPDNIRIGQTYYVNLELGKSEQSVLIPRGAFFQTTGGNWIFVLAKDGSRAYKREIRIGRQNPQYYEVLEGLENGEQVIVSGYELFQEKEELQF